MDEFVVALRPQRAWSSLVAWDLFLSGTGAGLFFLAALLPGAVPVSSPVVALGGWLGLALVGAAGLVLLADLGVPSRFLRVLRRPRASWLSRGAWTMLLFLASGFLALLPSLPGLEALPWRAGTAAGTLVAAIALALALALMTYTGLLLSSWNSIPFWNTPLLPLLFVASGLLAAAGMLVGLAAAVGAQTAGLSALALGLIFAVSFALLLYLVVMRGGTAAARESVRLLLSGRASRSFVGGALLLGLLVPFVLLLAALAFGGAAAVLVAAGLAILAGAFQLRNSVLSAGVFRA